MKSKLIFLAGVATGFLLGSRAGRQAYERFKAKVQEIRGSDSVQKVADQARDIAGKAAKVAEDVVSDGIDTVADRFGASVEGAGTSSAEPKNPTS